MRKLVLQMGGSIDGYVATIDGAHDWGYEARTRDPEGRALDDARARRVAGVADRGRELADEIARLKSEQGGGYLLAHGGARFAQALSRDGLVGEYRLVVHTAALGDGLALLRICRAGSRSSLAHTYSTGAAIHLYRPR